MADLDAFQREKPLLRNGSAGCGEPSHLPTAREHSMAGHNDRPWVPTHRDADRSRRPWLPRLPCEITIGDRRAARDAPERSIN